MTLKKKQKNRKAIFPSKNMLQWEKSGHNSREQLAADDITLKLFLHLCSLSCLPAPVQSRTHPDEPPSSLPPSSGTWLISGCLCHGLEMTGAGSPLPWQATAQITPLPERANALLMNNKSTLITNCQPNQLALQLSQTVSPGTAARHYGARCPV